MSMKIKGDLLLAVALTLLRTCTLATPLWLVTQPDASLPPPAGGGGSSQLPLLTPDVRFVLFASTANNLVANGSNTACRFPNPPRLNVYRRDRATGATVLVSFNEAGTGGGLGESLPKAISDDGRFALFESSASNLVSGDTNGVADIFRRDLWSNVTQIVSVGFNGDLANGLSRGSTMTPDGRYIGFTSLATNLVAGDTNGVPDLFVRDMQTGLTVLATPESRGAAFYNPLGSESADLSADGQYVAFYSVSTNVVPGVTNRGEIYLRDLGTSTTVWVSVAAHDLLGSNAISFNHILSADGSYLAYEACTNRPSTSGIYRGVILRYHRNSGLTDVVGTNAFAAEVNPEDFHNLAMTSDGRFICFVGAIDSQSPSNTVGTCLYRWDAQTGLSQLVSTNLSGSPSTNDIFEWPAMDASGRYVTYLSNAKDLVTNALAGEFQIYHADLEAGTTKLISADTNGVGVGVDISCVPQVSSNGVCVAFEAFDADLVAGDRNHAVDVFLSDLVNDRTELISAHHPALPCSSADGPSFLGDYAISADGNRVSFASEAMNLVPADTNGLRDVFVCDLFGGSNLLVSVNTNGGVADGISRDPALSLNGQFVVFTSDADDLVVGDTNGLPDVFWRSLPDGPTKLVSVNSNGFGSGNLASGPATVSADGRFVVFRSYATNLAPGILSYGLENLYMRDLQAGVTYPISSFYAGSVSATPDGRYIAFAGNSSSQLFVWDCAARACIFTNTVTSWIATLSIGPDGSKIGCFGGNPPQLILVDRLARTNGVLTTTYTNGTHCGPRFSLDGRYLVYAGAAAAYSASNQVYRYDTRNKTQVLFSAAATSGLPANGISDSPEVSADGRFVAYRSFATNLSLAADTNDVPDVVLYDTLLGTTTLIAAGSHDVELANNRARTPLFSPDGRVLFLQSWAANLAAGDFNQGGDIFALPFLTATLAPGPTPAAGPTLSWPNRPGETYQAQFKDDLSSPIWLDVFGTINFLGNRASITDPAPAPGGRFYRVTAH